MDEIFNLVLPELKPLISERLHFEDLATLDGSPMVCKDLALLAQNRSMEQIFVVDVLEYSEAVDQECIFYMQAQNYKCDFNYQNLEQIIITLVDNQDA